MKNNYIFNIQQYNYLDINQNKRTLTKSVPSLPRKQKKKTKIILKKLLKPKQIVERKTISISLNKTDN